jgi:hypothetical protein
MTHLTDHDFELLSAFLDGELGPTETAEIESRLQDEPELERTLAELRWLSAGLRRLPARRAPRRYWLTPDIVGQRTRTWRLPALRLASAVLALALVAVIGLDFMQSAGRMSLAGAPQELQAPAAMQENLKSEEPLADKTEQEAPSLGAGQGAEETPQLDGMRASAPTLGAESAAPQATPPMALAVPEAGQAQAAPSLTPSPLPLQPEFSAADQARQATPSGPSALRWAELLLGAGLVLLLVIQIASRR